jgi:hypothetical protein
MRRPDAYPHAVAGDLFTGMPATRTPGCRKKGRQYAIEEHVMHVRWYRPEPGTLGYLIVKRIFEVRVGKAEVVLYWHYR